MSKVRTSLIVLAAIAFATARCHVSISAEPAAFLAEVPENALVFARVARLDELDTKLQPLASTLGVPYPPFGKLLETVKGLDMSGDAVVGVALVGKEEYLPFVLLPVTDYDRFVEQVDGDPTLDSTPIVLAGVELVASKRGRWALVANPSEETRDLSRLDKETREAIAPHIAGEAVTIVVPPAGLAHLDMLTSSRSQNASEIARLRRMHAASKVKWNSLDYWRDTFAVYQPVVSQLQNETGGVVLAVDKLADGGLAIRAALIQSRSTVPPPASTQQVSRLAKIILDRPIGVGSGEWGSHWTGLLTQSYIGMVCTSGEFLGVYALAEEELEQYQNSMRKASDAVQSASVIVISPAKEEPTNSNAAFVVRTEDAKQFLGMVDEVVSDWNRLVEKSRVRNKFLYDSEPIKLRELQGTRYKVDLPTAFGGAGAAHIRDVMAKMYGRNGVMVMDVLAIDEHHVLVSDLPDKLRDEIVACLQDAGEPKVEGGDNGDWQIDFDPALLQDWLNDVKKVTFGGNIIGWKQKRLESKSHVLIRIHTEEKSATATAEIQGELLEALARLLRPKK